MAMAGFSRIGVAALAFVLAALAVGACSASSAASPAQDAADAGSPTTSDASDVSDASAEANTPIRVTCDHPDTLTLFPQGEVGPFRALSPSKYEYGRCELVALIVDAAIELHATTPDLSVVGVDDLSQADGEIPGTDVGEPRHPAPSHTKGFSADLNYFRLNGKTLEDSPACPSKTREFCEGPHDVDVVPTARFFAHLAKSKRLVQIIVDPMMVDDLTHALDALAEQGTEGASIARAVLISGIELHTDHFHISVSRACFDGVDNDGDGKTDLDDPDCADAIDDDESK
jgi:hypothetical protein